MKKYYIAALGMALAFASCNKSEDAGQTGADSKDKKGEVENIQKIA